MSVLSSFEKAYLSSHQITGSLDMGGGVMDAEIHGRCFIDCKITNGSFSCSTFLGCTFINVTFNNLMLDQVEFRDCVFSNVALIQCSLDGMQLHQCEIGTMKIRSSNEP